MSNINTLMLVEERTSQEYMLRQLAEECVELAQASLKLIRAWNGETPVMTVEARHHLIEELADVSIMTEWAYWCLLNRNEDDLCDRIEQQKLARMVERIMNGGGVSGKRGTEEQ